MNILILGGNSQRHYDWIRELGAYMEHHGHTVRLHDYRHWSTGEQAANIDGELERLSAEVADMNNYVVIAKSIGTVIAALGVARGILRPTRCVLLGIPLDGIAGRMPDFLPSLTTLPPTVIVQNEHDPYGVAGDVEAKVDAARMTNMRFVTVPDNDTHDYTDFARIEEYLAAQ